MRIRLNLFYSDMGNSIYAVQALKAVSDMHGQALLSMYCSNLYNAICPLRETIYIEGVPFEPARMAGDPTAQLDGGTAKIITELLLQRTGSETILIFATHDLSLTDGFDQVIQLR